MPELPEVETVMRTVAPRLIGRTILDARFSSRFVMRDDPVLAGEAVRGRQVQALRRHGKFLVIALSGGVEVSLHLGMTGKLLWDGTPGPYTRAVFETDRGLLLFDDIRQFGRIELDSRRAARLGPDALAITEEEFVRRLASRRGRIKPLLLNQAFVGGMGNIYTDEALFRARIHPLAHAERLSPARARRLYQAMREVLGESVARGGSSISDYVDAEGRAGAFQLLHRVYGKEGEPCPTCGGPIRRIVVGQRGTHYCPRCQRV
ncbi:MAG TPA: bifunctional DNA-formamidopyrimidine glycosylase/DNA-(apurinic or apyrimidinic site) lyase [Bryobacteraceae bacterium]|nr:bifunctional DNA-formamidopyrimidine glycosylase/DNA-(apurinic or apyrimidinic site) lyase [Bryobacteraceae bacterium]